MTETVEQRIERQVLATHRQTVADLCALGRTVAASWTGKTVSEGSQVTDPLARQLDDAGLREQLLSAITTGVDATGGELPGSPVPAAPYVVVTSRGPLCRATLDDGRRVVLLFELFAVERRPRTYRFRDPSPDTCLTVRLHR